MGTPQIDDATWERGLVAARALKTHLEARVVGKKAAAWRCGCGACGAGESTVKAVSFPTSYRSQLGMHILWSVNLEDGHGKRWSTGITQYIRWMELYPLFRSAFKGIDVCTDHTHADYYDDINTSGEKRRPVGILPSSRLVVVRRGVPVLLRPKDNPESSVFESARLLCGRHLPRYNNAELMVACQIDPDAFGHRLEAADGHYYKLGDPSNLPTFHIKVVDEGYVPIARMVSHDPVTDAVTFALDDSVVEVQPAG